MPIPPTHINASLPACTHGDALILVMHVHLHVLLRSHLIVTIFFIQSKTSEFCAPLTSFDWNETDPNILGASSIDTTCTIWGLEVSQYQS